MFHCDFSLLGSSFLAFGGRNLFRITLWVHFIFVTARGPLSCWYLGGYDAFALLGSLGQLGVLMENLLSTQVRQQILIHHNQSGSLREKKEIFVVSIKFSFLLF